MKKIYEQPLMKSYSFSITDNFLTSSIPITDDDVDDSGKSKSIIDDDDDPSDGFDWD